MKTIVLTIILAAAALATSHREAPGTSKQPKLDSTDF